LQLNTEEECAEISGHYTPANKVCYANSLLPNCRYYINLKCYPHYDLIYTASTCANIDGFFTTYNGQGKSGTFCYYKQFNCTYYSANQQCYKFKFQVKDRSECNALSGYHKHGYCYSECPVSKYLINDYCYDNRSAYTPAKCKQLQGFFSKAENVCYYKRHCISGHLANEKCYPFVDPRYTASTCANIGGYFVPSTKDGNSSRICYFMQFNCTFHAVNGQCYRFRSAVDYQTECDSIGGYYLHGYCYYECPANKFLINDQCYFNRSAEYSLSDCEAVGGLYIKNYCYLKECNYTMINNKCYKYRSANYSNGTCINIGGYYRAEAPYPDRPHCYYTTFNCRYHLVNGQCYSRSSNESQTVCSTIQDSYYDVISRTCYYYCTEIPDHGQCYIVENPSMAREVCEAIRGFYLNGVCYYITSHCRMLQANNGQCYTNRSTALTCNTCGNIGGYYQNGSCYYYRNHCKAYSVGGQCYSNRSSSYSSYSCNNKDGLYRNGYCYYEASKCRTSYYKNCSCFRYRSSSKTAGTCANIGGYYDVKYRACFYNSSFCRYYAKTSQCFVYRSTNFSRTTCTMISGYYSYTRINGRYTYLCYHNKINCSILLNNRCYLRYSASYNEGTCASIGGYYSQDDPQGCYYNSSTCRYSRGGQCYDKRYSGWSRTQCQEVNGYYYSSYYYTNYCYLSNYYCPYVVNAKKRCYLYASASYDCNSCPLLDGHFESGRCLYSQNCSQPLFLATNGQCYRNKTTVRTAADCNETYSFYDGSAAKCYFTPGICSSGMHEVNCQCFVHSSSVYTNGSCSNFRGQYFNGICYYNTSYCRYYSINNQCYQRRITYNSHHLCRNIGGYFSLSTPASTTVSSTTYSTSTSRPSSTTTAYSVTGTAGYCYYNSFSCSGYVVDRLYCYMNRSVEYSRGTCRNIGGIYGYLLSDGTYRRSSSYLYSSRTYYCLYNTFDCTG